MKCKHCGFDKETRVDIREDAGDWAEEMPTEFAILFECDRCGSFRELTEAEWYEYYHETE